MDPYSAPSTTSADSVEGAGEVLSEEMISSLLGTGGWVRFLSIMGGLVSLFMVLGALGVGVAALGAGSMGGGAGETSMMCGMAVFYLIFAGLYVVPTLHLHRYASAISQLKRGGGAISFQQALHHQMRFWRFVGFMFAALMLIYVVVIVGAVVVGGVMGGLMGAS